MKAIVIARHGGPEVLELRDVPEPEPGPGQVQVRVRAAALNRADLLQRRGRYPAPPDAPADIPGLEFAGEVLRAGPGAGRFPPGARVMGIVGGGGYAERVAVHEGLCLPVPPGLGWTEAAAIPEAFLTAFDALYRAGQLAPGETVLIHAAASGVGTAAVQLARACQAEVVALSRTESKRRRLAASGVAAVLDPGSTDLARAIRAALGGRGVDLVLDLVGAAAWSQNLDVLACRGRLVVVGLLGGSRVELDLGLLMQRRLTIVGRALRTRPAEERIELVAAFAEWLESDPASRALRPIVDRVFALEQAAEAHATMEQNANFGKIVLSVDLS
jgi:putative PIG3 family NAD(P)H quinone oxidoreductase